LISALDGVRFEIPDGVEHGARLDVGLGQLRRHKVGPDALAQVASFPDVDDAVEPIAHQVHTGLVRHLVHLLRQVRFLCFSHAIYFCPEMTNQQKLQGAAI